MADICEVIMLICFGVSWPINIRKLWVGRTAKGASLFFYIILVIGYLCGIASKIIKLQAGVVTPWYVWFFYILNPVMISAGILIWLRNRRLDLAAEKKGR